MNRPQRGEDDSSSVIDHLASVYHKEAGIGARGGNLKRDRAQAPWAAATVAGGVCRAVDPRVDAATGEMHGEERASGGRKLGRRRGRNRGRPAGQVEFVVAWVGGHGDQAPCESRSQIRGATLWISRTARLRIWPIVVSASRRSAGSARSFRLERTE